MNFVVNNIHPDFLFKVFIFLQVQKITKLSNKLLKNDPSFYIFSVVFIFSKKNMSIWSDTIIRKIFNQKRGYFVDSPRFDQKSSISFLTWTQKKIWIFLLFFFQWPKIRLNFLHVKKLFWKFWDFHVNDIAVHKILIHKIFYAFRKFWKFLLNCPSFQHLSTKKHSFYFFLSAPLFLYLCSFFQIS